VCHAEMNAVLNKNTASLAGAVSTDGNLLNVLHLFLWCKLIYRGQDFTNTLKGQLTGSPR